MLVSLINIFVIAFSGYVLFSSRKKSRDVAFYALALFDTVYVLPLLVELFLGKALVSSSYVGFVLSVNDEVTEILYGCFVIIVELFFFLFLKKSKPFSMPIATIAANIQNQLSKNTTVIFLSVVFLFAPLVLILLSPNPSLYLFDLGAFDMKKATVSAVDVVYRKAVHLGDFTTLAFISVIILKIVDKKNKPLYKMLRIFGIAIIAIANGKRTFVTFLIIVLTMLDFLYGKKKKYLLLNITVACICLASFFVAYAYVSGKYELNTNWYSVISEYFFRNNSVKVAIYSTLHPDKLRILDYPGQTLLFDVFFFVPRQLWASKPFPFPDYYTSAILGFSNLTTFGWNFQTNIYAEFVANLGFIAFFIAPAVILFMCKRVNESKGILEYILGAVFIILIQVFEFSDMLKVVLVAWLFMIFKKKIKMRSL